MGRKIIRQQEIQENKFDRFLNVSMEIVARVMDYFCCIYILLMLVVPPLYFEEGYNHIGTDKFTIFRKISTYSLRVVIPILAIWLILWILKCIRTGRRGFGLRRTISVMDLLALAYGIIVVVSYLGSEYRVNLNWGFRQWYLGLYTQLLFLGSYWVISRFWKPREWVVLAVVPVSAVVLLLGLVNRYGIYPIKMWDGDVKALFLSTVGNINWLCGYLCLVIFIGIAYAWQGISWMYLYVALAMAMMIVEGSASGYLGLGAAMFAILLLSGSDWGQMRNALMIMVCYGIGCLGHFICQCLAPGRLTMEDAILAIVIRAPMCLVILGVTVLLAVVHRVVPGGQEELRVKITRLYSRAVRATLCCLAIGFAVYLVLLVINTRHPGSLGYISGMSAFTFDKEWGSDRGATFSCGWMIWKDSNLFHKLVGIGPDAMGSYIKAHEEIKAFAAGVFGNNSLTNAHNDWLTKLVNCGILGAAAFVGLCMSFVYKALTKGRDNRLVLGLGLGVLAYTANCMFSFETALSGVTLYVFLGIGNNYLESISIDK